MAIDQFTVHPTTHGFGFTIVYEGSDEPYLRQGNAFKPWGHAEAVNRAVYVAGLFGFDAEAVEGTDEDDIASMPVIARHDGHICTVCDKPIPATGGRGRPRKIHVECAAKLEAEKEVWRAARRVGQGGSGSPTKKVTA